MPDWVTTELEVTGPPEALRDFLSDATYGAPDRPEEISFWYLVPCPETYRQARYLTMTDRRECAALYASNDAALERSVHDARFMHLGPKPRSRQEQRDAYVHYGMRFPVPFDPAEIAAQHCANQDAHGHGVLEDWLEAHWGVDRDLCHAEAEVDGNCAWFKFDTAWSAPLVLLEILAARYPRLRFNAEITYECNGSTESWEPAPCRAPRAAGPGAAP
jgi:hypothetical protein